ncbi:MAG TPA: HdeD family acid-resistance protein [Candidatus Baltobacteraceae bacterium]|nr:HdeD family acid-resistance protein [Candidatus Baltobacteraceae bacterium]
MSTFMADVNASMSAVRKEWGWFLALGIALVVLGVAAVAYQGHSTIAAVIALGAIMIAAGIFQLALTFQAHGAGHVVLYLLLGALDVVVGFALIQHPVAGALLVTLVLSVYFLIGGIYRVIYALWLQFPQYGWVAFSGLLMAVLGVMLWAQWPISAAWFIGFAVGINFIFVGVSWIALAISARRAVDVALSH